MDIELVKPILQAKHVPKILPTAQIQPEKSHDLETKPSLA
jgi:hypothetical protein